MAHTTVSWSDIAQYFDELLDEAGGLLSPKDHDQLLFDDLTFERSRRYFWAIDALSTFIERIQEVLEAFTTYKKILDDYLIGLQATSVRESIYQQLEIAELEVKRLESQLRRFQSHLHRSELLRDGVS